MKSTRRFLLLLAGFIVIWIGSYLLLNRNQAARDLPELGNRTGQGSSSAEFLNAKKAAEFFRYEIRRNPEAVKNYVQLAQIFLQEARATGRHHEYVPKAQSLLDEALSRAPNDFEALITRASVLMSLHQFQDARRLAEKTIAQNQYNAFSYGVLCDALVEMGEYEEAVKVCDKMLSLRPDLRSYARAAYLRELHGDPAGALQAMEMACSAGVHGHEDRAWTLYQAGKIYLNEGKLDSAAFIFNGILLERPEYGFAMSGLAEVKNAKQEHDEAIELVKKAYQIAPEHLFLEQLVKLYRASGQEDKMENLTRKVFEAYAQHEAEGWNVDLEFARFCLENDIRPAEALERARKEFDRRPNNVDALEMYAWALHENGKASEAQTHIEKAMRLNTRRAGLYYHAGVIAHALGHLDRGEDYVKKALEIDPYFSMDEGRELANQSRSTTSESSSPQHVMLKASLE